MNKYFVKNAEEYSQAIRDTFPVKTHGWMIQEIATATEKYYPENEAFSPEDVMFIFHYDNRQKYIGQAKPPPLNSGAKENVCSEQEELFMMKFGTYYRAGELHGNSITIMIKLTQPTAAAHEVISTAMSSAWEKFDDMNTMMGELRIAMKDTEDKYSVKKIVYGIDEPEIEGRLINVHPSMLENELLKFDEKHTN